MKTLRTLLLGTGVLSIALVAAAQSTTPVPDQGVSRIKAADFGWMSGRWIGRMQGATAEQICSSVQSGEMLCLFRVFVQERPAMYELYTLEDTPTGPELRSLNFSTDLVRKTIQRPLVMKLTKYSEKEVVFAGIQDSEVDTSTLTRDSATTMKGTILFKDQKQPHIHVRWEKVPSEATVDYSPLAK